jgi:formamidopyrimidine-DNA glycosylase
VVKVAVDKNADSDRFPKSWLFHHRWERGTRTAKGEPIEHIVVATRTTAFVPSVQKRRARKKKKRRSS